MSVVEAQGLRIKFRDMTPEQKEEYRKYQEEKRKADLENLYKIRAGQEDFLNTEIRPNLGPAAMRILGHYIDTMVPQFEISQSPSPFRFFVLVKYLGIMVSPESKDTDAKDFTDCINWLADNGHILYGNYMCGKLEITAGDDAGKTLYKLYCYSHLEHQKLQELIEGKFKTSFYTEGGGPK